jgi:predicted anti-sigma-YlaC factor YlaD
VSSPEDIACREVVEIVTDYLEGALPSERREGFELHLSYCDGCVNYFDQVRATIRLSRELGGAALPESLQADLLRLFGGSAPQ